MFREFAPKKFCHGVWNVRVNRTREWLRGYADRLKCFLCFILRIYGDSDAIVRRINERTMVVASTVLNNDLSNIFKIQ